MTSGEFNKKYEDYLEDRFDGMMLEDLEIIELCDKYFKEWVKIPYFEYAQIKLKFNSSRVYCSPYKEVNTSELEEKIDEILKKRNNG